MAVDTICFLESVGILLSARLILLSYSLYMSWLSKLKMGFQKTAINLTSNITKLVTHKPLNQDTLNELEEILIRADIGAETAMLITSRLSQEKFGKNISTEEITGYMQNIITLLLQNIPMSLNIIHKPHIVMLCGANGSGKTTTAGKLAFMFNNNGYKTILAACDTFRAAAVEQLSLWAAKAQCPIIHGVDKQDPSSVAYRGLEEAVKIDADLLIIDTAGRIHTQHNLMAELVKCAKVLKKLIPSAPHDIVLVLDGNTGQNALAQVAAYKEMINITGLIITKLDSTAKGGIIVALAQKYYLPVYAIGIGEGIEDLSNFAPKELAEAIVGK